MKPGRVIEGEVHDARALARQIVEEARAEVEVMRAVARKETRQLTADAEALAQQLVGEARRQAEDVRGAAVREAAQVRRDARQLAGRLLDSARRPSPTSGASAARRNPTGPSLQPGSPASPAGDPDEPSPFAPPPAAADGPSGTVEASSGAAVGRVTEIVGLVVRAELPGAELGEIVHIERPGGPPLHAEAIGFRQHEVVLMPLGELAGIAADSAVVATGAPLSIRCGDELLGRVLDGLGQPLDGGPPIDGELWSVDRAAPSPYARPNHAVPLPTGVRAIDGLLSLARGQRIGIFAAAGVGKSTLLGQMARGAHADVVVMCQVGERGRELGVLRAQLAASAHRTIAVCATSDAPPLVRVRAVHVATAIAEWFRERRGASVLLLVDSLTRLARAQREVGLSAGEPVARHGYPPSVFAMLPRLIERTGSTAAGHITAVYTVLVAGNDFDEPIADEVRGLVDGHLVLERRLSQRAQFPPIDVVASISRMMGALVDDRHRRAADRIRRQLAIFEEHRDMVTLGAYKPGTDPSVDAAVRLARSASSFLAQEPGETSDWDETLARVLALAGEDPAAG
jgi:ATP synthase in type III secretion protein N